MSVFIWGALPGRGGAYRRAVPRDTSPSEKNADPKPENRSSRVVLEFWGFLETDFLNNRSVSRAEC